MIMMMMRMLMMVTRKRIEKKIKCPLPVNCASVVPTYKPDTHPPTSLRILVPKFAPLVRCHRPSLTTYISSSSPCVGFLSFSLEGSQEEASLLCVDGLRTCKWTIIDDDDVDDANGDADDVGSQ